MRVAPAPARARFLAPALALALAGLATGAGPGRAQDNVLDLRVWEADADLRVTYQNFIYARTFAGGRFLAQALYLRVPVEGDGYEELAAGAGVRAAALGDATAYLVASLARATDGLYFEPALLVQDVSGRFTGSLYLQRYSPLADEGLVQWLIDPLEGQVGIRGPLSLGAALYAYRPSGGDWLTKLGPKVSVADRAGATELRSTWRDGGGGHELQLRRLWIF